MAAIFCLFSVTLCRLSSNEVTNDPNSLNLESRQNDVMGLSAQLVTVPRVYISPCPETFRYTFNGKEWFGLAVISKPARRGIPSKLKVVLTVGFHFQSKYFGELGLAKDKQSAVNDIANGLPILYRVKFPLQNPVPKLTAIYYNDQLICSGPKEVGQYVTTITLDHTFYTGLTGQANRPAYIEPTQPPRPAYQPKPAPVQPTPMPVQPTPYEPPTRRTQRPWTTQTTRPTPPPTQAAVTTQRPDVYPQLEDSQCGVPLIKSPETTSLFVYGKPAIRGQFPWLAAYFHNGRDYNGFICGGSLVSTKIVVTAAHCVQNKNDARPKKAEEATFHLGKQNINDLNERFYIQSSVSQLIIHSEWNPNDIRYDADIAIAVLRRIIGFNKFIQPICLWTATTSYTDIIGEKGIVAGWGKTEFDAISTENPMYGKLPVVSESDCLRSDSVFSSLTSKRTFCAGNRDQRGPCNGDSGGGFIIENNNKWYLRGIVSSSLLNKEKSTCDVENYAVFTDVTFFNSWIQDFVNTHG